MPKDNIERAIAKGAGEGGEADAIESVLYEGYGPGGVAVLVEALTENRNRTGAEVRHTFSKNGGSLGEPGSVAYLFEKKGAIVIDAARYSEDELMVAVEAGAEDIIDRRGRVRGGHRAGRLQRRAPGARGRRAWRWRAPRWPTGPRASCRSTRPGGQADAADRACSKTTTTSSAVHANFDVSAEVLERVAG